MNNRQAYCDYIDNADKANQVGAPFFTTLSKVTAPIRPFWLDTDRAARAIQSQIDVKQLNSEILHAMGQVITSRSPIGDV